MSWSLCRDTGQVWVSVSAKRQAQLFHPVLVLMSLMETKDSVFLTVFCQCWWERRF